VARLRKSRGQFKQFQSDNVAEQKRCMVQHSGGMPEIPVWKLEPLSQA
jgi:hypothetical protein